MEKFYTTSEAAKELRVGQTSLIKWINLGKVKTIKTLGGHNRITESELKRLKIEMGYEEKETNNV